MQIKIKKPYYINHFFYAYKNNLEYPTAFSDKKQHVQYMMILLSSVDED